MYSYSDLHDRQKAEDLRSFRKYLVDTGAIQCLVKLHQHVAKNEMRLDNPAILKEFLGNYREASGATVERERLETENATLREYNSTLEQQIAEASQELNERERLAVGRTLWKFIISREFWTDRPGCPLPDDDTDISEMKLAHVYERLCGNKVDKVTKLVLVDLVRPQGLDAEALPRVIRKDAFCEWVAQTISEDVRSVLRDGLIPRFAEAPIPKEPPYETDVIQAVRDSGLYPDHLADVAEVVELDNSLRTFLDAVAEKFGR